MARYHQGWYYSLHEFAPDLDVKTYILGDDIRDFVRSNYRSSNFYKIYLHNGTDCSLVGSCGNPFTYEKFLRFSIKSDEAFNRLYVK